MHATEKDPLDDVLESQTAEQRQTGINFRTGEVRDLSQPQTEGEVMWSEGEGSTKKGRPMRIVPNTRGGITQAQYAFIIDLLHDKNIFASPEFFDKVNAMDESEFNDYMRWLINRLRETTRRAASDLIEKLLALPVKPVVTAPPHSTPSTERLRVKYEDLETDRGVRRVGVIGGGEHDIIAGKYALDTSGDDTFANDVTFFRVWVGDRGGWKVLMYRSDEQIELNRGLQVRVAKRIAADPVEALARWGEHKSTCGVCSRKLTNDVSRAMGIGPVCRSRWSY